MPFLEFQKIGEFTKPFFTIKNLFNMDEVTNGYLNAYRRDNNSREKKYEFMNTIGSGTYAYRMYINYLILEL